jgi:hypothetical protein
MRFLKMGGGGVDCCASDDGSSASDSGRVTGMVLDQTGAFRDGRERDGQESENG